MKPARLAPFALAVLLACGGRPFSPAAPATYFGRYQPADFRLADCFTTSLRALGAPSLLEASDSTFRITHLPYSCEFVETWTLTRTPAGAFATYAEARREPTPNGPWRQAQHQGNQVPQSRWTQWLTLRDEWHAFAAEGGTYDVILDGDYWLLEWSDASGYHRWTSNALRDGHDHAWDWLAYLARSPSAAAR